MHPPLRISQAAVQGGHIAVIGSDEVVQGGGYGDLLPSGDKSGLSSGRRMSHARRWRGGVMGAEVCARAV